MTKPNFGVQTKESYNTKLHNVLYFVKYTRIQILFSDKKIQEV